jgi:hypothetical protein
VTLLSSLSYLVRRASMSSIMTPMAFPPVEEIDLNNVLDNVLNMSLWNLKYTLPSKSFGFSAFMIA